MIFFILFVAWTLSVLFYFAKIRRIAGNSGLPVFSSLRRYHTDVRPRVKNLYLRIVVATIILALMVALAYFVDIAAE